MLDTTHMGCKLIKFRSQDLLCRTAFYIVLLTSIFIFPLVARAQEDFSFQETVSSETIPLTQPTISELPVAKENTGTVDITLTETSLSSSQKGTDKTNNSNSTLKDTATDKATKQTEETVTLESTAMLAESTAATASGDSGSGNSVNSLFGANNSFYGDFTYSYPIELPKGRNGLQPELAINYSSSGGTDADIFGHGWSINIPYIQRVNKYGIEKMYTASSTYFSSLSGELVQIGPETFRAKVDNGSFLEYELQNNTWIVRDKSGLVYTLGSSSQSRVDNATSTNEVFKWMLNEVRDTNDNYIEYTYVKDGGSVYPETITYTGHGSTDGIFEINFTQELKTKSYQSYSAGFLTRTNKRVSEIAISVDGSWVRKYEFDYRTGDNATRDLLDGIIESGKSNTLEIAKPKVLFEYASSAKTMPESSNNWELGYHEGAGNDITFYDDGEIDLGVGEINGDGLPDLLDLSSRGVYLNDGDQFLATSQWQTIPNPNNFFFGSNNVRFLDVNGDQLSDLVYSVHIGYDTTQYKGVYLNNGASGWQKDTNFTNSLPWSFVSDITDSRKDQGFIMADINGDGLVDILKDGSDSYGNLAQAVYINNGTSWSQTTTWVLPPDKGIMFKKHHSRLVDVNSDGLADIVSAYQSGTSPSDLYVHLNNGKNTWVLSQTYSSSLPGAFIKDNYDQAYRMVDINSDGLTDIVQDNDRSYGEYSKVYINDGSKWATTTEWTIGEINDFSFGEGDQGFFDINGDTLQDFAFAIDNGTDITSGVFLQSGDRADVLKKVTNSHGGVVAVSYSGTAELGDKNGNQDNPQLPINLLVADSLSYDNGQGNTWSRSHEYTNGDYYYAANDIRDRQFVGFATITTSDSLGATTNFYHQNNGTSTNETNDSESKIGFLYRTETKDSENNLYQVQHTNYLEYVPAAGAKTVLPENILTIDYDGDSDTKAKAISYEYVPENGNVKKVIQWGEVSNSSGSQFTDIGTDVRSTEYVYATTSANGVRHAISKTTLKNYANTKVSESIMYYDELPYGSVDKGNLTTRKDWIQNTDYASSSWQYNAYGLPVTFTDARGNTTESEYDEYGLYIATSTNALGHNVYQEYDYQSAEPTKLVDANGHVFELEYDGFGRMTSELIPDPQSGAPVIKNSASYTDSRTQPTVVKSDYFGSSPSKQNYVYFDGFGNEIQTRTETEEDNVFVVRDFVYGSNNLLLKESLPYFSTGSSRTTPTSDKDLYTTYNYDVLRRIKDVINVVGTTVTNYDQWTEQITQPDFTQKEFHKDAFGRLTTVVEENANTNYETNYTWNAADQLTTITDAEGNERSIEYNGLGKRVQLEDLHDPTDQEYGVWRFAYDPNGNIASTTDPNGNTIHYSYDELNRPLTEDYITEAGTETTYDYDSCEKGVGQLCEVTTEAAANSFTYNHNGGVSSVTKSIDGVDHTMSYEYDRQGRETLTTYPDNSSVQRTYNDAGLLETVSWKENGGLYQDLITDFDYAPSGQVSLQHHGNGVITENIYDENELYRLRNKHTYNASTTSSTIIVSDEPATLFSDGFQTGFTNWTETIEFDWNPESPSEKTVPNGQANNRVAHADNCTTYCVLTTKNGIDLSTAKTVTLTFWRYLDNDIDNGEYLKVEAFNGTSWNQLAYWTNGAGDTDTWHFMSYDISSYSNTDFKVRFTTKSNTTAEDAEFDDVTVAIIRDDYSVIATSSAQVLQDITYTYDVMGNVVKVVESDDVGTSTVSLYDYDELGRLTDYAQFENDTYTDQSGWYGDAWQSRIAITIPAASITERLTNFPVFIDMSHLPQQVFDGLKTDCGDLRVTTANQVTEVPREIEACNTTTQKGELYFLAPALSSTTTNTFYLYFNNPNATTYATHEPYGEQAVWASYAYVSHNGGYTDSSSAPVNTTDSGSNVKLIDGVIGESAAHFMDDGINPGRLSFGTNQNAHLAVTGDVSRTFQFWGKPENAGSLAVYGDTGTNLRSHMYGGTTKTWRTGTSQFYNSANAFTLGTDQQMSFTYDNVKDVIGFYSNGNVVSTSTATPLNTASTGTYGRFLGSWTSFADPYRGTLDEVRWKTGVLTPAWMTTENRNLYAPTSFYQVGNPVSKQTAETEFNATGAQSSQSYTYDALGNIISMSDQGNYVYGGTVAGSYANPHAVTAIGSLTYTYDRNGNQTTSSDSTTNQWTYNNRLSSVRLASSTIAQYSYNYDGSRVTKVTQAGTTYYPFSDYETTDTNETIVHVYAGDTLISSIENGDIHHNHLDHLNSTRVVSNATGEVVQQLAYQPFGTQYLNQESGEFSQSKQYTGHEFDTETELSYMGARYYGSDTGRFISQDPVSLSLGDWKTIQDKTGDQLSFYLQNPQTHNSYSYTANNPLKYVDRNGEYLESAIDLAFISYDLYKVGEAAVTGGNVKAEIGYLGLDIAGLAVPAGTGFGIAGRLAAKGGDNSVQLQHIAKQSNWGNAGTLADHAKRHGGDFGVTNAADYAKLGSEFRGKIGTKGVDSFTDRSGVTRAYEESTNTFASYNKNGTTRTIYKPDPSQHGYKTNKDYWNAQKRRNT